MPIHRAAMFQVDQVLSLIVVGARSRFHSGLCETSVCSSTKSRWVAGDSVVMGFLIQVLRGFKNAFVPCVLFCGLFLRFCGSSTHRSIHKLRHVCMQLH